MDVFLSYKSDDRASAQRLADALRARGLEAWFDQDRIEDFDPITPSIAAGLAASKVFVAWYSARYAASRPCHWELTTAYITAGFFGLSESTNGWRKRYPSQREPSRGNREAN